MNQTHDPYLATVKRSLEEQRIQKRRKRLLAKEKSVQKESYFSKKIHLDQILDLPDGLQKILFFILFLLIPYSMGLLFTFITRLDMKCLESQKVNEFLFFWTIGYEFSATMLLIFLIQDAFRYKKSS